jgi:hemolysin activation/secretion protein
VNQTRYPEILFSTDTTKIYVYVEKSKPNRFDGFVGFSNDEDEEGKSKIRFNGYLDLMLVNALNTGEQFTIYWKSDGKQQKTFNAAIELPYIFRSPLGLKASLNIFKQDSTFQNTKTAIALGYFFDYNTRLYLGYDATESSDIQNQNTASISDFKNAFLTSAFEFTTYKPEDFLFPEKARAIVRTGAGSRKSKVEKTPQFFLDATLSYNFYLNEKNSINLKTQDFYLKSSEYLVSELYRFGGINSIRGFNENSLQANLFTSMLTEYRYVFVPGLYVHSIVDFGYYRDDTRIDNNDKSGNLLGLGVGFGLLNKNGLFNIVYANGTSDGQEIKLSNSIVQISFKASF